MSQKAASEGEEEAEDGEGRAFHGNLLFTILEFWGAFAFAEDRERRKDLRLWRALNGFVEHLRTEAFQEVGESAFVPRGGTSADKMANRERERGRADGVRNGVVLGCGRAEEGVRSEQIYSAKLRRTCLRPDPGVRFRGIGFQSLDTCYLILGTSRFERA